jgi:hypothetical protein
MSDIPELLTEHELAELLRVRIAVVRRLRKLGRPPAFVMVGAHPRYTRSAVLEFLIAGEPSCRSAAAGSDFREV